MLRESDLKEIGISQYGIISPSEIVFSSDFRKMCEENTCRLYGKTWACPPAVGTVEECKNRCLQYENAMVFNAVYQLRNSFDYKGMVAGHRAFKDLCDRLYVLVKDQQLASYVLLSNEGCIRCEDCTYPTSECRMPDMLFPSLEGFGINVTLLAKSAEMLYNNGDNTVTYFGMLLY